MINEIIRERTQIMLFNLCPIPLHHYGNKICFNKKIIERRGGGGEGSLVNFRNDIAQ